MSTHHGFLKEFPFIRVDAFDGDPAEVNPYTGRAPHFYLLTHAHTDHLVGLNSPHFHGQIYATPVTKHLLLETMETADRVRYEELGSRVGRRRKFANLRKLSAVASRGTGQGAGMDRVREIPLNTRFPLAGPDDTVVYITALDANHCPGSCMYLIEGTIQGVDRAVLVTGDIRIEPWWLDALKHNPLVAPYLPPQRSPAGTLDSGHRTLDCMYIDTSNVLLDEPLLTKDEAVTAAVELMAQYPSDTRFFLNAWTWGYEELLKAVHKSFGEQIHLDWYKHRLYTSLPFQASDPLLATMGTTSSPSSSSLTMFSKPAAHISHPASTRSRLGAREDPSAPRSAVGLNADPTVPPPPLPPLRFHACERRWKCDHVWQDGLGSYAWDPQYLPLLQGPKRLKRPGKAGGNENENGARLSTMRVVQVNPSELSRRSWEAYRREVQARLDRWQEKNGGRRADRRRREEQQPNGSRHREKAKEEEGELPGALIVPLARHSSLPELQALVALFRPRTLYPLTCTDDDPVAPAHQYVSLPSLFGPLLAPGGEAQLRDEAETYRRQLLRDRRRRRGGWGPPGRNGDREAAGPSIDTGSPPEDESYDDDLVEPRWVTEVTEQGLNVEGGQDVLEEVIKWTRYSVQKEIAEKGTSLRRKRTMAQASQYTDITPGGTDGDDAANSDDDGYGQPFVAVPARRWSRGSLDGTDATAWPDALGGDDGVAGGTPSPSLAGPDGERAVPLVRDIAPPAAPASSVSHYGLDHPIRPHQRVSFTSPAQRSIRAIDRASDVALTPSPSLTVSLSHPPPLSFSRPYTITPTSIAAPGDGTEDSRLVPARPISHTIRARPSPSTRAERRAVVTCLHRQLRGLLAPQGAGANIEPFRPGDPRLQGRRARRPLAPPPPLPATLASPIAIASPPNRLMAGSPFSSSPFGEEHVFAIEGGRPGRTNLEGRCKPWDSPTSFRTVSATTSP